MLTVGSDTSTHGCCNASMYNLQSSLAVSTGGQELGSNVCLTLVWKSRQPQPNLTTMPYFYEGG